ncbi:ErfK/YbiS/YcfS/YnhG family protein [gamma proteobacterium HTCC5015]|nr:ErfK/YbiS/YcfS/YnhG family protein [gamma proteobacterium HTCC5015]
MKGIDATEFERLERQAGELGIELSGRWLWVRGLTQTLSLCQGDNVLANYSVSTAEKGFGCREGSHQTPIGWHRIGEKIGAGETLGRVFKGRQAQAEIADISHGTQSTGRDCITSRILWLEGQEEGLNRGGDVDSHDRYIYIHGTHEEGRIGQAASIGCVRMKNAEVTELFERVDVGAPVFIQAD